MLVMKFGGTSLGNAERIRTAVRLVAARAARKPVVVVSAFSGVTDGLLRLAEQAASGTADARPLCERHVEVCRQLCLDGSRLRDDLRQLRRVVSGLNRRRCVATQRARDLLASFGERLSAQVVAMGLTASGLEATPVMAYEAGLLTDGQFGAAEPLPESERRLGEGLRRSRGIPVVTGFLGRSPGGGITTLGRGGSDYTAALVGAALGAEEIQIWTDVDGVMSADPRLVGGARSIRRLSFAEAAELAYFGAKVLHPKTLWPAVARDIPVRVLNTHNPSHAGTVVVRSGWRSAKVVKAIACKRNVTVVEVISTRMLLAHGFLARLFSVFAAHRIVVDLLSTSEVSVSLTVDREERLELALRDLREFAEVDVQRGRALICVVGEGLKQTPGLTGKIFSVLGREGVNVELISQGASRINLSFVVSDGDAERAVRRLHRNLFGGG